MINIDYWIDQISKPNKELDNMAVCPYAKSSKYIIVETTNEMNINDEYDVIVFVFPNDYSQEKLVQISDEHNLKYPDHVFLPDHKDRFTYINGVRTSNNKYNIILCQNRSHLNKKRDHLKKTNYYSFWNQEYLKEILGR